MKYGNGIRFVAALTFAVTLCLSSSVKADPVNIVLDYMDTEASSRAAVFEQAATIWEGILNEYSDPLMSGVVTIDASILMIDGPGGTLGSAGPRDLSQTAPGNTFYTRTGQMRFDIDDIANLESAGTFDDVILHEMAHVMGFGTLWNTTVADPNSQNWYTDGSGQYTGPSALNAWQTEFGQSSATFVPVELGGGPGTRNGHWNEVDNGAGPTGFTVQFGPNEGRDLQNELMTGWLNSDPFISDMTRASFADIGYNVVFAIPEPSSVLVLLGISAFGLVRRRA